MRKLFSTLIQAAGIGTLVFAAFEVATVLGFAALGTALVVVGVVAEGA